MNPNGGSPNIVSCNGYLTRLFINSIKYNDHLKCKRNIVKRVWERLKIRYEHYLNIKRLQQLQI